MVASSLRQQMNDKCWEEEGTLAQIWDSKGAPARTRAVARALIGGGGGCIFIYSCYARRISFEISCF